MLFSGDTLFRLGCGKVFEGTLKQMYYSLQKINNLPEAYDYLEIPIALQIDPKIINMNKSKWIEEWLNAS